MEIGHKEVRIHWMGQRISETNCKKVKELIAYHLAHGHLPTEKKFLVPNIVYNLKYRGADLQFFDIKGLEIILYELMVGEET